MNQIIKREPVVVNPLYTHPEELRCSLSGEWLFRLDPNDVGVKEGWFNSPFVFQEYIQVPGCWQGQGFGNDHTEMHKEFHTAIRPFKATYEGTGWYAKRFTVPTDWAGKRIWLNFGGSNPTTEVWLNGEKLGEHHLPLLAFGFEITDHVKPGVENVLVIRISELDRLLGLTYYYCGKWSGLYRDVELTATGDRYLDQLSVLPNADTGEVKIKAALGGAGNAALQVTITAPDGSILRGQAEATGDTAELTLVIDQPALWCPEHRPLYRVDASLVVDGKTVDARADRFGFVHFGTEGKHFMINHQPYYMRGTGDFGENPETGSPNTDRDHWRKCLQALRDMGYNYVRCQSFVPVPEYFDAADEVGLIVQSEMGMLGPIAGKSMYYTYNMWPKPTPDYRDNYREQWNGVVQRDVNHPSANIYCMSNELSDTYFPKTAWRCYYETKAIKPTSLVIWTDGRLRPQFPSDFVNDQASSDAMTDLPVIQHEFKWWSSFPDVALTEKYKGCAMRPFAAEMAIEVAGKRGLTHILPQAAKNSQILQFIEAKCKMEQRRRDYPTLAGICHFNAMDTGMSPQGLIDMFYEQKYVTAEQWQQTNGDTVIMNSINFDNRILLPGMEWHCTFFVSDFAHPSFGEPTLKWSLEQGDSVLADGELTYVHEAYRTTTVGEISLTVPAVTKPQRVLLKAKLVEEDRVVDNAWDLWIFPAAKELPEGVYRAADGELIEGAKTIITPRLTDALVEFARKGGAVILIGSEGLVRPFVTTLGLNDGRYYFTRPANFPPYEELQDGTIIQPHPIFGDFPCETYADLQFYNMMGESPALDLEGLDLADSDPIIRMIHSYQVNRPLGYLVERKLGDGYIAVTSMKIDDSLPESMYLLGQMARYAQAGQWQACPEISALAIEKLISGTNIDY